MEEPQPETSSPSPKSARPMLRLRWLYLVTLVVTVAGVVVIVQKELDPRLYVCAAGISLTIVGAITGAAIGQPLILGSVFGLAGGLLSSVVLCLLRFGPNMSRLVDFTPLAVWTGVCVVIGLIAGGLGKIVNAGLQKREPLSRAQRLDAAMQCGARNGAIVGSIVIGTLVLRQANSVRDFFACA